MPASRFAAAASAASTLLACLLAVPCLASGAGAPSGSAPRRGASRPAGQVLRAPAPVPADAYPAALPDGGLLVNGVIPGSPGEQAGLASGDWIVAVDGQPLDEAALSRNEALFQRDGAAIQVTVERAGKRFERSLTLRRLI